MADDTAKNQQNDAPMPEWLKNAQVLAAHEEKGADAQTGDSASSTGGQSAAAGAATGVTSGTAVTVALPSEAAPAEPVPGEVADAPLPDWLKKAADKSGTAEPAAAPTPAVVQPEVAVLPPAVAQPEVVASIPVVMPPEVATPTPAIPLAAAALPTPVTPVAVVTPEVASMPATAAPTFINPPVAETTAPVSEKNDEQLPGWLQKIQREQKEVNDKGAPAEVAPPPAILTPPLTAATPPPTAEPVVMEPPPKPVGQEAGQTLTAPIPAQPRAPAGLLETSVVTSATKEVVVQPVAEAAKVNAAPVPAQKPAAAAANKTDLFKSAESAFLSFLGKSKKAIEKGQIAGISKKVPAPAETAGETSANQSAVAPSATPSKPGTPKVTDKTTAEERRQMVEGEKIYQQGLATIRDLISPSSIEVRYDMIRIEGMYSQSFYVFAYPRYLDTNWLSPVINFDVTMDIAQFIYPIDSATIMRTLKKKVAQMQASVRINAEKGMVSDPALDTALQDAEELRTSIQRGQEKFFQFALYFTIYSEDEKKITKTAKQLESILGGKLILTKKTELQMEPGFNSVLPMCLDELEVYLNMNTSPLSSTFPFSSSDLTSNEGILYGLNRHNDSLIIFDRFSLENANSVVFAKSGAGKSYCVKLEVLRSMMVGTDVIVIDPENEYEALAQTVGGAYLRVSLTSDRRINPFDLPSPMEGEEVQPGDLLRQNIISLHGLMKIMLGGITPEEEGIMDKALNDVYSLKGITMELVDPTSIAPPTMEDLYDILSSMEGGQSLAQRLQKFTIGTYSGIFNKPTNVDLESGMMVFCIRDLEDALRPIAMYIILNYIWNRIRSKLKKRILVIDEAWTMMQHEDSARFLFGLVKRARKYYLGISTITQDVEDFVKSPFGKPVVTNSSMQLLLKQAPAAIDILTKVFNLTQGEKYMLLNSGVGQGLFFAGLKHVAIQIIASYTEDKIVTTNPEEILQGRKGAENYETA